MKHAIKHKDTGYISASDSSSDSEWEVPTIIMNYGDSFARQNDTKRKSEDKLKLSLTNNKSKSLLCSTTVATLAAKHLNIARSSNLKEKHFMHY